MLDLNADGALGLVRATPEVRTHGTSPIGAAVAKTSDCGQCSDSTPCAKCGVADFDATHLRAQWSELVASTRPGLTEFWRSALIGSAFFDSPGVGVHFHSRTAQALNLRRQLAVTPAIAQMPPGVRLARIELLSGVGMPADIVAMDAPPPPASPGSPDGPSVPESGPTRRAKPPFRAPPPPANPGAPDDSGGAGHDPDDPFSGAPEVEDDVKDIIFKLLDRMPSGGAGECCPELQYAIPENPKVGFGEEVARPRVPGETGPSLTAFPIGFAFSWEGVWKEKNKGPSGRDCSCECCEFVHIIVRNKWDVTPTSSSARGGEPSNKPPSEDKCTFWMQLPDGTIHNVMRPRFWGSKADLENDALDGAVMIGRHCYGDRTPESQALPEPEKPEYLDACHMNGNDEPSHPLYDGYRFTWSWVSYGVVLDTCVRVVSLIRELSVEAEGFLLSSFDPIPNIMPSQGKSRTVYARPSSK